MRYFRQPSRLLQELMPEPVFSATQPQLSAEQLEWSASQDLAQGVARDDVIRKLIRNGMSSPAAMQLVTRLQSQRAAPPPPRPSQTAGLPPPQRAQVQQSGNTDMAAVGMRNMLIGLAVFVVGAAITIGTYMDASSNPRGGTYTVCWGAVIFGGIRAVTGLMTWLNNR